MVNTWLPDPANDNPINELQPTNGEVIMMTTDTSDEEDEQQYDGYQPLPLGPCEDLIEEESSDEEIIEDNTIPNQNPALPPIIPIERILVKEVWSKPTSIDIEMDKAKADEVKMAMANFTLPSSSIPDWAVNIPEDQWKQQLIDRIQSMQENNLDK